MGVQTITTKRAAEDVGQAISLERADYLKAGFKQAFPLEKPFLFISKATIFKAIENLEGVSGVRFMYGFESVNDPESRMLLLIPCNNTSTYLPIPNSMMLPGGYMADSGKRISFEKTWQVLYNHTVRFGQYFPGLPFNEIMRGMFIGINSLRSLVDAEGCAGINFNFGYDDAVAEAPARNKPVLESVGISGFITDPPIDLFMPCPPYCRAWSYEMEKIASANLENQQDGFKELALSKDFRDEYLLKEGKGALVEMYYYANPTISEKITAIKNSGQAYNNAYEPQITAFNNLIAEGYYEHAKNVFEDTVNGMIETFLFQ